MIPRTPPEELSRQQGYRRIWINQEEAAVIAQMRGGLGAINAEAWEDFVDGIEEVPMPLRLEGDAVLLSDIHLGFHCRASVLAAINSTKRLNPANVVLNGDILDAAMLSTHPKTGKEPSFPDELNLCRKFLANLRLELPKARIIFKEGNHEVRIQRYIYQHAEAFTGLIDLPSLLDFGSYGVEHCRDTQMVQVGSMQVFHGHELKVGGLNPARSLFLKTGSDSIIGHVHRNSQYQHRRPDGTFIRCYSVGTLCKIQRGYAPYASQNNGFAYIDKTGKTVLYEIENGVVR